MSRERSAASPSRSLTPSEVAHQYDKVIQELEAMRAHLRNRVVVGLLAGAPGSASTQASGVGNTDWNVNVAAGIVCVGGVITEFAAQADFDVHSGSLYTGLIATFSAIAALVCRNIGGTITMTVVKGTAVLTANVVAPTDAAITAALGATVSNWIKIAELTLNRTADTVVTQSENNTKRPELGSTVDAGWGDWEAIAG